jgi:hypothetical protein
MIAPKFRWEIRDLLEENRNNTRPPVSAVLRSKWHCSLDRQDGRKDLAHGHAPEIPAGTPDAAARDR